MNQQREDDRDAEPPTIYRFNPAARYKSSTQPCPHCGELIAADAQRCSHCDHAFVRRGRESSSRRMPLWVIIGALLALLAVLSWTLI